MYTPTLPGRSTHTDAHTLKYVILTAFSRQQWLRERASLLRYTCDFGVSSSGFVDSTQRDARCGQFQSGRVWLCYVTLAKYELNRIEVDPHKTTAHHKVTEQVGQRRQTSRRVSF